VRQTLPKPKRSSFHPLGGLPPKARKPLFRSLSVCVSVTLIPTYVPVSLRHISTWNCQRTDKMIPTYMELSTDRTFVHIIHTNRRANRSSRVLGLLARDSSRDETSRERLLARDFVGLLARLLADFLRETPRERLLARDFSGRAENATTNQTTTMATGDDDGDDDDDGNERRQRRWRRQTIRSSREIPWTPRERLLARDSSQDSLQETSIERLLARVFLGRAENATTNHERAARWHTMTTMTMAAGDDDDDDNNGDGAADDEVHDDGDDNDYGDGQRQRRWQRRDGQRRDRIRQRWRRVTTTMAMAQRANKQTNERTNNERTNKRTNE
jgi:hypothetical protein